MPVFWSPAQSTWSYPWGSWESIIDSKGLVPSGSWLSSMSSRQNGRRVLSKWEVCKVKMTPFSWPQERCFIETTWKNSNTGVCGDLEGTSWRWKKRLILWPDIIDRIFFWLRNSSFAKSLRCRNDSCCSRSEPKSMPFFVIRMSKLHGPSPKQQMLGQGKYRDVFSNELRIIRSHVKSHSGEFLQNQLAWFWGGGACWIWKNEGICLCSKGTWGGIENVNVNKTYLKATADARCKKFPWNWVKQLRNVKKSEVYWSLTCFEIDRGRCRKSKSNRRPLTFVDRGFAAEVCWGMAWWGSTSKRLPENLSFIGWNERTTGKRDSTHLHHIRCAHIRFRYMVQSWWSLQMWRK